MTTGISTPGSGCIQGHSDHRAPQGVSLFHDSLMHPTSKYKKDSCCGNYTVTNTVHTHTLTAAVETTVITV